tara:strand:- start:1446 stop:1928 length:483 start_codon:yes stop_codon:yes gene_type:complete
MKVIKKSFKHADTWPLPCWIDEDGVLQYDTNAADELVCMAYGNVAEKYELDPNTLELYYNISEKMKFKVAEITYESFFTDVLPQGKKVEKEFREDWETMTTDDEIDMKPEDFEIYNLTLFHYDHPSLKSKMIKSKFTSKSRGSEYLNKLIERIKEEQGGE